MTSTPKTVRDLGRDRARTLLDTNNGLKWNKGDQLFSLLEGGEGTLYLRDMVDHFLNQRITSAGIATEWNNLREYLSIKDKIAYATGVMYDPANTAVALDATTPIDDAALQNHLSETITFLQDELISKQEFTESWIMRHAVLNRFECKLTPTERGDLNTIANKIKEIAKKNNLETLLEASDFTNESDAQKIIKLTENLGQMTARGITVDEDLLKKMDALEKKVQPIKDLDKRYKHMINMINMTGEIAKVYSSSMISVSAQERLHAILGERGKKDGEFIIETQGVEDNNFALLKEKLRTLKDDSDKYNELLKKHNVTPNQFEEWFLVYFANRNVEVAKEKLDGQKAKTLGHREGDYQQDVNRRRGGVRERIFEIAERMTGEGPTRDFDPAHRDEDLNTISSYFDKFKNIFYANERDAYDRDGVAHFKAIRDVLAAMLRHRNPAIVNGPHARYGSMPRQIKKWFERFFKGKEEKGIFKMIKKRWHNCDHAEILAMVMMLQNQTDQQLFHGKTPFEQKDKRYSKVFRGMGLAAHGRQKIADNIAPATNTFLKIATAPLDLVGKGLAKGGEAYTGALKKYHRLKTPLYTLYPLAKLAAQGPKAAEGIKKWRGSIRKNDKPVENMFEIITDTVNSVTDLGAKGISKAGTSMYRKYQTNQQRGVLDSFFAAAAEDEHRKEVLQSSDLANMFSMKHRETYIFDEDGRTQMVDKTEKGEKTPEGSSAKFADKLEEQIEKLIEQSSNDVRDKKLAQKTVDAGTDEKAKVSARLNLIHANEVKNVVNNFQGDLSKLIPILKKSMTGTPPARRYDDIRSNLGVLIYRPAIVASPETLTTQAIPARAATTGWLTTRINELNGRIGNPAMPAVGGNPATAATGLIGEINNAKATVRQQLGIEKIHEGNVQALRQPLKNGVNLAAALQGLTIGQEEASRMAAQQARMEAEDAVANKERELNNAKDLLARLGKTNETLIKVAEINDKMNEALLAIPPRDTKPIAEEFNQLTKYLDVLLYPEEKIVKMVDITKLTNADLESELSKRVEA